MHAEAYQFVARCLREIPPPRSVVEIGGRDVNGTVRRLFGGASYIAVDVRPGPGVDIVADGATYSPPEPPEVVVCCEVLEHAANAREIVANAHRMLAPGGALVLTAAAHGRQPHGCDGGPVGDEFYRNVTVDDLRAWVRPFRWHCLEVDPEGGDIRALVVKA